jgi:polysaccharide chain length determinant protein (PEP-CTERM system associated)
MNGIRVLLFQYAHALWRRRWYAIGIAWAVFAAGAFVISRVPDYYLATARVYMSADEALTPLLNGIALDTDVDARVDRLQRTMLSNTNMRKLIRMTDLDSRVNDAADRDAMVASLQKTITIRAQTRNLFTVSYTDTDPRLAESVVSNLLSIFMESSAGDTRADIDSAQRFVEAEIDRLEAILRDDERKKAEFQSRYYDLLPGTNGVASRVEQARADVVTVTQDLADALAERDDLVKQRNAQPRYDATPVAVAMPARRVGLSVSPEIRLAQLKAQLDLAKATMTDEHPVVIALRHQIALAAAKVKALAAADKADQGAAAPAGSIEVENPVYRDLTIRLADAEERVASLRRHLASAEEDRDKLDDEARKAPGVAADFVNLDRDYDVVKRNYEDLLARREAAEIGQQADRAGHEITVRTIDPPEVPILPAGPNRALFLSLAFVASLGSGIGTAFVLSQLDTSFTTTTALRLFGLEVLGSIARIDARSGRRRPRLRGTAGFVSACAMLALLYGVMILNFIAEARSGT